MKTKVLSIALLPLCLACGSVETTKEPQAKQEVSEALVTHEVVATQGLHHFVYISADPIPGKGFFKGISKDVCKGKSICIAHYWNNKGVMGTGLPMTDTQLDQRIAAYNLNENTGLNRVLICAEDGC